MSWKALFQDLENFLVLRNAGKLKVRMVKL